MNPFLALPQDSLPKLLNELSFRKEWKLDGGMQESPDLPSYFDNILREAEEFLSDCARRIGATRGYLRRSQDTTMELLSNCSRHMRPPPRFRLVIGCLEPGEVLILTENSCSHANFNAAAALVDRLKNALTASERGPVLEIGAEFLEAEKIGGLGLWTVMTQLSAKVRVAHNRSADCLQVYCLIPKDKR